MNRMLLLFGWCCIFGLTIDSHIFAASDKPNILWLVSEDNDTLLGCYGDPVARTPTLDRLAKDGILFEKCFAQPVCAPSRFTLITGMYPVTCGPAHQMRAQGHLPTWITGFPTSLRAAGYYCTNNAKTDYNSPLKINEIWNANGKQAHYKNRAQPDQPFFSVFNHEVTHESCLFPVDEKSTFDPAQIRIPAYQPDTHEIRADWARYYTRIEQMDQQLAAKLKELADEGLAENTIIFYYSDNGGTLPRSKRYLHESGTHVPLIVYFPEKWRHLSPAAPGSRMKDPVHFIDFAPTVLSLTGLEIPKHMQGNAFAGPKRSGPREFSFSMRDRMDERYDMMRSVISRRWLYIRNFRPDLPYVQPLEYQFKARGYQSWAQAARMSQLTPATSQFWGPKPSEELYDMDNDPDNVRNLASDPEHRATLDRMRAALRQRVIDNIDNGFLPEGSLLEGYDASRVAGAYPIDRVFDIAVLASDRNPANLPKLIAALDDTSEPIRWWGAQGCTMLGEHATAAESALQSRFNDRSGAVQIAAAEAMAKLKKTDIALPILERWIAQTDHPAFALQAGNVFDRIGPAAAPSIPAMTATRAASNSRDDNYSKQITLILSHALDVLEGRQQALVYPPSVR